MDRKTDIIADSVGLKIQICQHCKEPIEPNMVQQGGLHIKCFNEEIQVYKVMMAGSNNGYYRKDLDTVIHEIKCDLEESAETEWRIKPETMLAGKYYNLPDFGGF